MYGLDTFGRQPPPPQAPKGMPQVPGLPSFWTEDDDKADAAAQDVMATITIDQTAAFATARAWTSKKLGMPSVQADKAAAVAAVQAQKSLKGSDARTSAAQAATDAAAAKAAASPNDLYVHNLAAAWKAVLAKAQAAQPAVPVQSPSSVGERMDGLDCFGCDEIGFGLDSLGPLFQAGGGMAQGAISDYEKDEAKKKASAADKAAADKAIAADVTASLAAAKAGASAKLKQPSAQIDAVAASNASTAQDRAAATLSAGASELRAHAADDALNAAVAKAQANPSDVYLQALVAAWTATLNKAQNRQILTGDAASGRGDGGGNWLTDHSLVSALPNYGTVGVGAALLGGAWWAVKRFF